MRKRRMKKEKKVSIFDLSKQVGTTVLDCSECGQLTECSSDAKTVTCGRCVLVSIPLEGTKKVKKVKTAKPPKLTKSGKPRAKKGEGVKYKPSGFPRGWHFKKLYIHTDGKTYSRGKLVTDKKKIAALAAEI